MPLLIEHIVELVLTILTIIVLGTLALVGLAIARRQRRERFFQRMDALQKEYRPVIAGLLAETVKYEDALRTLRSIRGVDRIFVLEQLCLGQRPRAEQVPRLRRLCEDLGLVEVWQHRVLGDFGAVSLRDALGQPEGLFQRVGRLGFLLRAKSAENLGTIQHQPSWRQLVKALDDSHPDVQGVALRALGAIGEPQSLPALIQRLQDVILNPETGLSLREVKRGLVAFPVKHATALLDCLGHSHRRVRFLATDIIREMSEREAGGDEEFVFSSEVFPPALVEMFLAKLCFDANADVRARSAPVISYLSDPRATPVLVTLLEDPEWFVRLHAVRAMAKRKYLPQLSRLAERLTDAHWMVRADAVKTLLVFSAQGVTQLSGHFLKTEDRYSREQIADELQRAGLIPVFVQKFTTEDGAVEGQVLERLVEMGKTSYMLGIIQSSSDHQLLRKFLERFGRSSDPQIRKWVLHVATTESDPALRTLARASVPTTPESR